MFPHLKAHWHLSDSQLGALASIVSITVAIGTVPLSLLADRWNRVKSIVLMALVWSFATIACAFARDYSHLFAARSIVGLGEAAYGAAGAALLAGIFPQRMRSTVLGAFLAAGLVGSVLGVVLGGVIAEHWGWRAGFGVVGIPGLILALVFRFVVREDPNSALAARPGVADRPALKVGATLAAVLRPRTLPVTCVGAGLQLVVVSTIWAWLPSYFNRYHGLTPDLAGVKTGLVVLLGGVGAIVWSAVADRLTARHSNARLYVPAAAGLATALLLSTAFGVVQPGLPQFLLILAGATAMTGTIGPVAAVVVDVTHPAVRATATAVLSLAQNLIGLAVGPLLTGALSDRFGLPFALTVVPLCGLLAAATLVLAARTYGSDQRKSADTISGLSHAPKPQVA